MSDSHGRATAFKYVFFGGAAFALDFALLWLLKSGFGLAAWYAASVAFVASTCFAFFTQMRYTFRSTSSAGAAMVRYGILLAANMVFTAVVVSIFDAWWGAYMVGKVASTATTTTWNYFLMKHWVFPRKT